MLTVFAGCGGPRDSVASTQPSTNEQVSGGEVASTPPERKRDGGSSLPSEAEIKAAQRRPIKVAATPTPAPSPADAPKDSAKRPSAVPESSRDLSRKPRELRTVPGPDTAPADVLALATRAGKQWLAYRVNGEEPSAAVIPAEVWKGVPPMSPDERAKGAAAEQGVTAVSAHPQKGGWVVMVGTEDPRLPQVLVRVEDESGRKVVEEIGG